LKETYSSECTSDCNGKWLECGLNLLQSNDIPLSNFCYTIFQGLNLGGGKYRNVFIYAPANAGKTFILSHLRSIFKTFTNPKPSPICMDGG
jgi:hypothetical protein